MILSLCTDGNVLKIIRYIKIIINTIFIIVPILLLVTASISYLKAISNGDNDSLAKTNKAMISKCIAAVIIFFIPLITKMIVRLASTDENDYISCIENATPDGISNAYVINANDAVSKVKKSYNINDYNTAKEALRNVEDELEKRALTEELEKAKKIIDLKQNINKLKTSYSEEKYNEYLNDVNNLEASDIKNELLKLLNDINENKNVSLNVESGFKEFNGIGSVGKYTLYTPTNAKENMPLIIVMPAKYDEYNTAVNVIKGIKKDINDTFIAIVKPNGDYSNTVYKDIVNVSNSLVDKYKINNKRISVTGFSSSGSYVFNLVVNNQNYFSAILALSSGLSSNSPTIQNNLSYLKSLPIKGYGENGGQYDANGKKCSGYTSWSPSTIMTGTFKTLGKESNFTNLGKMCHTEVRNYVFNLDNNNNNKPDVIEWMISQKRG